MNQTLYKQESHSDIDFSLLLQILKKNRVFIIIFTLFLTLLSSIYIFLQDPVYRISVDLQVGSINKQTTLKEHQKVYFFEPETLKLYIVNNFDNSTNPKQRLPRVEVTFAKNTKDILHIDIEDRSNSVAKKDLENIVEYINKIEESKFNNYIENIKSQIDIMKEQIEQTKKIVSIYELQATKVKDSFALQMLTTSIKSLNNEILELRLKSNQFNSLISPMNIIRSSIIGHIKEYSDPVKPKYKLFILLSAIISFLIALFLILLRELNGKNK